MGEKLKKAELVSAIAEKTEATKVSTEKFLNAFIDVVSDKLTEGYEVPLPGFGIFKTSVRPERPGTNPATGEVITIPAKNIISFRASSKLKARVNN